MGKLPSGWMEYDDTFEGKSSVVRVDMEPVSSPRERTGLPLLLFCALLSLGLPERLRRRLDGAEESGLLFSARLLLGGGMFFVSLCFLIGASYNPFLYFRF